MTKRRILVGFWSVCLSAFGQTVSLSTSTSAVVVGQPVTLTATVTPGSSTGKVTFYDGVSVLGAGSLASAQASLTTTSLTAQVHSLRAFYSGVTSAAVPLVVSAVPAGGFPKTLAYSTGSNQPTAVAVGDFNGDGHADFAAATTGVGVSVFLGNGDGSFQAPVNYSAGSQPEAVLVGDFNQDGNSDLAVADDLNGTLSILAGNGDGTFQPAVNTGGVSYRGLALVADLNGDGKPDLVALKSTGMAVLLGNGDGTFQNPVNAGPSDYVYGVAAGDFNGDGKADLVVVDYSGTHIFVMLGNGDGTFQSPITYSDPLGPISVAVGDFNGDGRADLAVANFAGGAGTTVSVLLGNGDGTFRTAVNYGALGEPASIVAADFDGDGKVDLLTLNLRGSWISTLSGNGDGTFGNLKGYPITGSAQNIGVADFNGDGREDLVLGTQTIKVNVMLAAPPLTQTQLSSSVNPAAYGQLVTLTAAVIPLNATGVVAFYDGTTLLGTRPVTNGLASINTRLLASGTRYLTAYYTGSTSFSPSTSNPLVETVNEVPDAGFRSAVTYATSSGAVDIIAADFNGDGRVDVAVANRVKVSVFLGNGDGTLGAMGTYNAGNAPYSLAAADFNGDGIPDLAAGNDFPGTLVILTGLGNGTFQTGATYLGIGESLYGMVAGDFNGDGKADLAVTGWYSGVHVLLGNGDGTFQTPVTYPVGSNPNAIAIGDFNGDGKADLVATNASDGSVSVLIGKGDGTFHLPLNYGVGTLPIAVAVADLDGDGKADLVVANNGSGNLSILVGNGDGSFRPKTTIALNEGPSSVVAADFNGDRQVDLAITSVSGGVTILNGSAGEFQPPVAYNSNVGTAWSVPADFNGDGRVDLAVAGQGVYVLLGKTSGSKVGVFRRNVSFLLDSNGNGTYDAGVDRFIQNFTGPGGFVAGDVPVTGDWTGDGASKVGIYRASTGTWYLDANNNGVFDAGDFTYSFGGLAGDMPFAGDWMGIGKSCIGIYRSNGSLWLLDLNCNGSFDNTPADAFFPFGGLAGDVPVVGAWSGGATHVGVVRKYAPGGVPIGNPFFWVPDAGAANEGNQPENHPPDVAKCFAFGGLAADIFVTGDWFGAGVSQAGVYRNGTWLFDAAVPSAPQASHVTGQSLNYGGLAGDVPVVGKW